MEVMDKSKVFDDYMESFSKLSLYSKQKELLKELKLLIALVNMINTDFKQEKAILLSKDKLKESEKYTNEDEYFDYLFSLVQCLKEEVGKHLDGTVSKLYK